jgi:hypothetical protein
MVPAYSFTALIDDNHEVQVVVDWPTVEINSACARLRSSPWLVISEQWMFGWLRCIARALATPVVVRAQPASSTVPESTRRTSGATAPTEAPASVPRVTRREVPVCRVVVGTGRRGGSASVIPRGARHREDARWIPPGGRVSVKGFDIPGGMVYVGGFLSGAPGAGWGAILQRRA